MLILISALPALIARSFGAGLTCSWLLTALAAGGMCLQARYEGYRWQMLPAYALVFALGAALAAPDGAARRWWVGGVWVVAIIAAGILYGFPLPRVPLPGGPYAIGTEVRHLVDPTRLETLSREVHGPREVMIQLWYPAASPRAAQPDKSSIARRWLGRLVERPPVRPAPLLNAPIASAQPKYPVLIFSPSWHGQRDQNRFQVEELVSRGFIVVGIDHPYSSTLTIFPDGRKARAGSEDFFDLSSAAALAQSITWIGRVLEVRVKDIELVANELEKAAADGSGDRFSGRLDWKRLGVFGYSFGGAAAAQACWEDARFKAGMNMGGSMYGEVAEAGIRQPFLFMDDQTPRPTPAELAPGDSPRRRYAAIVERDYRLEGYSAATYGSYELQFSGAEHIDFTDPPARPTWRYYLRDHGAIAPQRAMRTINAYTVAFFSRYLNHSPEPLLDGPSPAFSEVIFLHRPGHAG